MGKWIGLAALMVVVEKYPDLKANETFIRLMDEIAGSENRIAVAGLALQSHSFAAMFCVVIAAIYTFS